MTKTGVEYADYSWNPITGCFGPCGETCAYCYAVGIARRFAARGGLRGKDCEDRGVHTLYKPGYYHDKNCQRRVSPFPYGFDPTFHRYRLADAAPASVKKPSTIFVGDMADMFGRWVPDEWIQAVFEACERAPQHRYLFLTKNPQRLIDLRDSGLLPPGKNFWYGSTVECPADISLADPWKRKNTFASVEPVLCNFPNGSIALHVDWVIVGRDTSNRKDKVVPKREWIENIVKCCRLYGVPVFLKDNLRDIWAADLIQEYPEGLR